jgi:glycosyltransferase involved in cell wall biosynthesis
MKILQITPYYPPSIGGIQFFVKNLCAQLTKLGHEVSVLTVNSDNSLPFEYSPDGFSITRSKLDFNFYRAVISRELIKYMLGANSYDIFHIHIPFHIGLEASILASKRKGIPIVATHHGQGYIGNPFYKLMTKSYSIINQVTTLKLVDRLIFLTQSYADSLTLPSYVKPKIRIVRTGADIENFAPITDNYIRDIYGVSDQIPIVLFVGSLHRANTYKGVNYLLQAFVKVRKEIPAAKLVVIGSGELLPELQTQSKLLSISDNVIFTGLVDNSKLASYYHACDFLVLPSISGPENSPVVVLEAMACGKPVIATSLPGVCDLIDHQENGLLVEPRDVGALADAILYLSSNKVFRLEAGKNARKKVEGFTWQNCAIEMSKVYMELLTK